MRKRLHRVGRAVLVVGMLVMSVAAGGCASELQTERDALYTQNQELQNELGSTRGALEAAEMDRSRLVDQLASLEADSAREEPAPASGPNPFSDIENVDVDAGAGQIAVRVPGDVLFAPGKAEVQDSAKRTLDEVAGVLKDNYSGRTIRVEGYTDTDPIRKSNWRDNLELSTARATSVERYLESQGVPGERMYSAGFGAARPRETKAQSRRVEIVVLMQ